MARESTLRQTEREPVTPGVEGDPVPGPGQSVYTDPDEAIERGTPEAREAEAAVESRQNITQRRDEAEGSGGNARKSRASKKAAAKSGGE